MTFEYVCVSVRVHLNAHSVCVRAIKYSLIIIKNIL